jgi:hypothetical protein
MGRVSWGGVDGEGEGHGSVLHLGAWMEFVPSPPMGNLRSDNTPQSRDHANKNMIVYIQLLSPLKFF